VTTGRDRVALSRVGARGALALTGLVALTLLAISAAEGSFGRLRGQVLLTFVGLAVGALLAFIQLKTVRRLRVTLMVALAAIAASQAAFLLLVWTGWRTTHWLWRAWWVSMVPSVCLSHVLLLQAAGRGRRGRLEKVTIGFALIAGAMFLVLGLRTDLLADVPPVYLWIGLVPVAAAAGGSAAVAVREVRSRARTGRRVPTGAKVAILIASHALLLTVGLYLGRRTARTEAPFTGMPSPMAHLPPDEVRRHTDEDLRRLKTVTAGLEALQREMTDDHARVRGRMAAEGRGHYLPEEDDRLRWRFVTYLSYRSALRRLVATYSGFQAVREPALRGRCFMLGHAAAQTACQADLSLVTACRDDRVRRRKLNEAEPAWGIPSGAFDRISERLAGGGGEALDEMAAYFDHKRARWAAEGVWRAADFDWLAGRIAAAGAYVRANRVSGVRIKLDLLQQRVKGDVYNPVYAAQSIISEFLGDTRIVTRPPFISHQRIDQIAGRLRPGDIILERRNWFLSNAFLPGFWPHAALYVGTVEDLRALGVADRPEVAEHLADYAAAAPDGRPHTIIEAVSEGVVFNSLHHSLHADYVAVLRPRLARKDIAEAVVRAFQHRGKPYDFEFDFFTADKLVCTELVYRCYEGSLHFKLVRVMGRDTLPAIEIVRKFAAERGQAKRELDFVLFLDADPAVGSSKLADEAAFRQSAARPRSFNE